MDARIATLTQAQHGVFSRAQALAAGVPAHALEHRLERGRLIKAHRGVYVLPGHPTAWMQQAWAGWLAAGTDTVLTHRSAGYLLGLLDEPGAEVELAVAGRHPTLRGVVIHRTRSLHSADVDRSHELPTTSGARTAIDLAAALDPEALEESVDIGLRRHLFTVPYLRRRLDAIGRGREGAGVLVALLDERSARRRPMGSKFERRLFVLLREAGLPLPIPQYEVRLPSARPAYIDLAYPEARLAIEADSYEHHSSHADCEARDHTRNRWLVALGWRPLPITWADLVDGSAVQLVSAALCPVTST